MTQVTKIQQILQRLDISFNENSFHALFSHVVRNHENFDKDEWEKLIQFDKNWEAFGFRKAKEIYSSNMNKMRQSTKKQIKPHIQYIRDEVNSSNSINLDLESFDSHRVELSRYEKMRLECEVRSAKHEKALEELKTLGYKYLDWLNGWRKTPDEVAKCGHKKREDSYSLSGATNLVS
ncbi:5799_t:CDS:2 [Racocetra fulgida]|uniref:5799_t:CDS:1 n=1 Tax=Racocetra fulgida TaxID=60492 RepID=A0A9N9AWL6_9GLOM|nr:5799_t:CDS:2 [Racocetra fulgida]